MTIKEIIKNFLTFKNALKMYHWRTKSYNKHKISDELGEKLDKLIDKFIEVLIGSRKQRPEFVVDLKIKNISDDGIEEYLEIFRHWVSEKLPLLLQDYETDLLNIKDEMIAEVNQSLYLVRMD